MRILAESAEPLMAAWIALPIWARCAFAGVGGFLVAYSKLAWDIAFIKGKISEIHSDNDKIDRLDKSHAVLRREVNAIKESLHGTEFAPASVQPSHAPSGFPRRR